MAERTDQDSPWKELLDNDLASWLAFSFPDIHADLDWSRDHESLEQEFRAQVPAAPEGHRVADKVVKHHKKADGEPRYFHLEAQAYHDVDFPYRVHVYNRRAEDRFAAHVVSLALLVDDSPAWCPDRYAADQYGCVRSLKFLPWKLLNWRGREVELRGHENPVALFVLAALEAKRTRGDDGERERVKLELIETLTARKMEADDLRRWYRYLDWLLPLPPEAEKRVVALARSIEERTKMPFITFPERMGMEKGREAVLQGITLALKFKFGPAGTEFAAELREAKWERLQAILAALETASSIDELRKLS